jgi:hypothetical protein
VGPADPSVRQLAVGIRAVTRRNFDRHVLPLVRRHWPVLPALPFYDKLRIGACDLYASAPYTVLFCAPRPPPLVRLVTAAANALPLPTPLLALLGRGAVELVGRCALADRHRRIVLVASFIVMADHVLDHVLTDPPARRGDRLLGIVHGRVPPVGPEQALLRAIAAAMGEGITDPRERADFAAALDRVEEWVRAEMRGRAGEPDPLGLGHRLAGVEGGIDGLLFPVIRYAGEGARRWAYDVSMFMQIADDWLDHDVDLRDGCTTPVTAGVWGFADVEAAWRRSVAGLEALARAAGLAAPHYVRFLRDAYVLMIGDVLDEMIRRPEA